MQELLDLLMSNRIYMGIAVIIVIGLVLFLLKKVFKLFMLLMVMILAYGAYLYVTEDDPIEAIKDKLSLGKSAIDKIDDATQDLQREAIDKVIDEVDKKLKRAAKK